MAAPPQTNGASAIEHQLLDVTDRKNRLLQHGTVFAGVAVLLFARAAVDRPGGRALPVGMIAAGLARLGLAAAFKQKWTLTYKGHEVRFENNPFRGEKLFIDNTNAGRAPDASSVVRRPHAERRPSGEMTAVAGGPDCAGGAGVGAGGTVSGFGNKNAAVGSAGGVPVQVKRLASDGIVDGPPARSSRATIGWLSSLVTPPAARYDPRAVRQAGSAKIHPVWTYRIRGLPPGSNSSTKLNHHATCRSVPSE